jgi:hypothetical protein
VRRLEGEIQTIDTRRWSISASAGHSVTFVVPPFPHCPDRNSGRHATRSVRARESPIGNLLPKSETNGAFFLDANDNGVCRMNLSLFRGPGKDDLNPASIPISKRNSFPPRETWGRMTFQ